MLDGYLVFIHIPNKCNELDRVVYIYMLVKHLGQFFFSKGTCKKGRREYKLNLVTVWFDE